MVSFKKIKSYALVSVYNKKNINILCKILKKHKIGIISTGTTYKIIKKLGFDCYEISSLTKFNEVLDGRVKTLHPNIYISILHKRNDATHLKTFNKINFPKIDFVIIDLYPFVEFSKTKQANTIEMIDVGGPALLRAAAKNFENVTTISSSNDYNLLKKNIEKNAGKTDLSFRKRMAKKAFQTTSVYDEYIYNWFGDNYRQENTKLRYGENPDQKAELHNQKSLNIADYKIQGKEISYNNILDIDSGLDFLYEFKEPTAVVIKHNNACGIASSLTIKKAFIKAFNSDKKSAFGGVVLINKKIDEDLARVISKKFFEVLVSPGFSKKALAVFNIKKNLILIDSRKISKKKKKIIKSVRMGNLVQQNNNLKLSKKNFKLVSKNKKLSKREYEDILFSFKVVKHIKSNAIVLVKNKQTVGIGAGQMNRYDATRISVLKYKENFSVKNVVCASDAFFPFVDSIKLLLKNNCKCIVVPNGSINDQKIIDFADKNQLKLIFSSVRVFKH